MKLQDKLDAFTAQLIKSGKIPEPIVTQLMEGIKEQISSGIVENALKAGETAPAFVLKDSSGTTVSSTTPRPGWCSPNPAGDWCPRSRRCTTP